MGLIDALVALVLLVSGLCATAATEQDLPCDPGFGAPRPTPGCSDPETGWLTRSARGDLMLTPFRTYGTDAEGRAYAEKHELEYPFSNDHLDVATGEPRPLPLAPGTICTGAIMVGYREPLDDHRVDCDEIDRAFEQHDGIPIPVAVWTDGDSVVQVSELYRP